MNLTYFQDHLYIDGTKADVDEPAKVYADLLIESLFNALDYSPSLQHEFFERLRPAAAAYYDWRIMPVGQWKEVEVYLDDEDDDFFAEDDIYEPEAAEDGDDGDDDDDKTEKLLDNLIQIRIAVNALIEDVVSDECD